MTRLMEATIQSMAAMILTTIEDTWSHVSKASAKDKAEIARLVSQLTSLSNKIRREFVESLETLQDKIDITKLRKLLEAGRVSEAIEVVNTQMIVEGVRPIGGSVTQASIIAGLSAASRIQTPTKAKFTFGVTNPNTINRLRSYEFNLIRELTVEARGAIRSTITEGMSKGRNPLTIARDVKQNIKLTQRQAIAVSNYRDSLENLNRASLKRALRDKRFDATINRAIKTDTPLSSVQIDKMVEAYQRKQLKYRSENIARTEATRANNFGNQEGWRQAVEEGAIREEDVTREWVYTKDKKTRDSHRRIPALNKGGVGLNEPFKSELGDIMYPGDPDADPANTIGCRCTIFLRYRKRS